MTPLMNAVSVHSAQVLALVALTAAADSALRSRPAELRLWLWRAAGLACLVVPFVAQAGVLVGAALSDADALLATTSGSTSAIGEFSAAVGSMIAIGIMARLAWVIVGLLRLSRLRQLSQPVLLDAVEEALRLEVAPRAIVRCTECLEQPAAFGWRRPLILLPGHVAAGDPDVRRALVCHELIHVARGDWLWVVSEAIVRAIYWFHPGVWWLLDQLDLSREQVVDATVVARLSQRRRYMEALVECAELAPTPLPVSPILRRRHLRSRLRYLSEGPTMTRGRLALGTVSLLVLVGGATLAVAHKLPLDLRSLANTPSFVHGDQALMVHPTDQPSAAQSQRTRERAEIVLPQLVYERKPQYTAQAMKAKIQGEVGLKAVVKADGTVGDVVVTKSLDTTYGLDATAVATMRLWRFKPGTRNGKPAAVQIDVQMTFTLK